jgi:hypothetical protein
MLAISFTVIFLLSLELAQSRKDAKRIFLLCAFAALREILDSGSTPGVNRIAGFLNLVNEPPGFIGWWKGALSVFRHLSFKGSAA